MFSTYQGRPMQKNAACMQTTGTSMQKTGLVMSMGGRLHAKGAFMPKRDACEAYRGALMQKEAPKKAI